LTPEASAYLERAREDLDDARKLLSVPLAKIAGRSAYFAAFHAAEALIVERTGKVAKTHAGVRAEFARLLKDASGLERSLATILARAYKYKELADYGVGRGTVITDQEACLAVEDATHFVDRVATLLKSPN
jgi:uncharacterized protein (UPF0332 family)